MNIEYMYLSNLEKLSQISNRREKKSKALIDWVTTGILNDTVVLEGLVESVVAEALKRIRGIGSPN